MSICCTCFFSYSKNVIELPVVYHFAPGGGVKYCSEHVCVSTCLSAHIVSKTAHLNFTKFSVHVHWGHDNNAGRYVLPVLSMMSYLPIIGQAKAMPVGCILSDWPGQICCLWLPYWLLWWTLWSSFNSCLDISYWLCLEGLWAILCWCPIHSAATPIPDVMLSSEQLMSTHYFFIKH